MIACLIVVFSYRYYRSEKTQQFDNVRDLLQGSIETDLYDMQDAYLRFKQIPNIQIIKVTDMLDKLNKVKVTYVFNQQIIGDMEFRYEAYSPKSHAMEFMNNLATTEQPI